MARDRVEERARRASSTSRRSRSANQRVDGRLDLLPVLQRREPRDGCRDVHVVRLLGLPQVRHEPRREDAVAQPQPRQPRPLREGAQDGQVVVHEHPVGHRPLQPRELDVGLVDDDEQRQAEQRGQVAGRQQAAVRVVRRREEQQLGARGVACRRPREIACTSTWKLSRRGARTTGAPDSPASKPYIPNVGGQSTIASPGPTMMRVSRSISSSAPCPGRMFSAGHARVVGQRRPQLALFRVGVDVQEGMFGERLAHGRVRAVWVLVRIELDDVARLAAQLLAQHLERQDGRVRLHRPDVGQEQALDSRHASASMPPLRLARAGAAYARMRSPSAGVRA